MKMFKLIGIQTDFERIFFAREFHALAGKRFSGLILLFLILFTTLLALGYAVGGLQLLSARMNNPFTNWVDVIVKNEDRSKIETIKKYFEDKEAVDQFNIKNVTDHIIILDAIFVSQENGRPLELKGRTISQSDVILETILNPNDGNWISGLAFTEKNQVQFSSMLGIIATRNMLLKLGYTNPEQQKQIFASVNGVSFLVPVEAVVKELPNYCEYCFTPEFYNLYNSDYLESNFLPVERGSENKFVFITNATDSADVMGWWNAEGKGNSIVAVDRKPVMINTSEHYHTYGVTLNEYPAATQLDTMFIRFQEHLDTKGFKGLRLFTPNTTASFSVLSNPHFLAFNFISLDKVDDFKTFMSGKFGFEINMAQIEAKKNFAIVSNLTWLMAALLFAFSLASIVLFLDNLLRAHIEKIKPNLGTFMAFGWDNNSIRNAYLRIVIVFTCLCIAIAIFAVIIYDITEGEIAGMSRFNIFDWKILTAVLFLLLAGVLKSRKTIDKILRNTPGNLIYNRDN